MQTRTLPDMKTSLMCRRSQGFVLTVIALSFCLLAVCDSFWSKFLTPKGLQLQPERKTGLKVKETLAGNPKLIGRGVVHSSIPVPPGVPVDRKDRFPSFAERLKSHLGNWYLPPCNMTEDVTYYRYIKDRDQSAVELQKGTTRKTFTSNIQMDKILWYDWEVLDHATYGPGEPYIRDIKRYIRPWWKELNKEEHREPPLIAQFGDHRKVAMNFQPFEAFPVITKVRPVFSPSQRNLISEGATCLTNQQKANQMGSVHFGIYVSRHRDDIYRIDDLDIVPWQEKIQQGVFRASTTGHAFTSVEEGEELLQEFLSTSGDGKIKLTKKEHKLGLYLVRRQRVQFCFRYRDSNLLDAAMRPLEPEETGLLRRMEILGDRMELSEMLKYKAIVVLEGNDVATSLLWILYSHSVAVLPRTTVVTFAMEEFLEPWVHFVPLNDDLTDADEKMQWILDHDEEARMIAERGRLFIEDLFFHPDSEPENQRLQKEILRRLRMHFQPMPLESTGIARS